MKAIPFYLLLFIISSCSYQPEALNADVENRDINPLDAILGDKLIDEGKHIIRPNNFDKLLSLSRIDLEKHSDLYQVKNLERNVKLLTQKKTYSEARNFDIILKLEGDSVSKYLVLNDSRIEGEYQDSMNLTVLTGDFENHNAYWNSENKISLLKFDHELNQVWEYTTQSERYPLRAVGLRNEENQLVASIEVITGCHICVNTFELRFTDAGNCISAIETSRTNSNVTLDSAFIERTFIK